MVIRMQPNTWAMICHLSGLIGYLGNGLGSIIGPLIFWLIKKDEIISISATNKTAEYGRWNVYTQLENFRTTTEWLQTNLKQIYAECRKENTITSEVPDHFVQESDFFLFPVHHYHVKMQ